MIWTRKKKLSDYQKAISEFNSDMKSTKTSEQYNNINKTYQDIKTYYEAKINKKDIDINIEKIIIERNIGIHHNDVIALSLASYIAVLGSAFYFLIQQTIITFSTSNNEINFGLTFVFLLGVLCITSHNVEKNIKKENPRNLMLNISLKVLDDIIKGIPKQPKENLNIENLATTITAKEKLHEYSKKRHNKKK